MKQQTAVEWLEDNYHLLHTTKWNEIVEQAKQMEKDQIIDGYVFGYTNFFDDAEQAIPIRIDDGEQYYKETYKK